MLIPFLIMLREGIEAALIVSIDAAYPPSAASWPPRQAGRRVSPSRRGLLLGLGAVAAAARAATLPGNRPSQPVEESDGMQGQAPSHGPHQAGVATPQPAA